jgi:outer membrane lipoprotein-sorting protein
MEDEGGLGELLVLMTGAHRSFRTLRGEVRAWHHEERSREVFERLQARSGGSSSQISISAFGTTPAPLPPEREDRLRIWLAQPDRIREEWQRMQLGERVDSTLVQVGTTWWAFHPGMGAQTNGGAPDFQHGSQLQRSVLDPAGLVASHELEITGRTEHAGRPAIRAVATPAPRAAFLSEQRGFDGEWPMELLVDAERGILLRTVGLLDGEPFTITEFTSLAFDEEIPDEVFVFVPPPGEEVRDAREAMKGHAGHVPLHEAAGRAAFAVFVPASVPEDWRMRVYFSEGDERRRWPSVVHVHYSDEMGRLNVNIDERAADAEMPPTAPDGSEWSVQRLDGRELRLWEPSEPDHGMPRLAVVELAGTRIQISSGELSLEVIAELAAGLVPAPAEPPTLG